MGEQEVRRQNEGNDVREFSHALLNDVRALEKMLADGMFEKGIRRIGAEQEMFLVNEDLFPAPQERFDHLHGLIQFLLNRWQLRKGYTPRNTDEALVDIQDSLSAAERGLESLERLVPQTSFGAANWADRREYLDLCLMTPLRSYRSRMLPHHEQSVRKRSTAE